MNKKLLCGIISMTIFGIILGAIFAPNQAWIETVLPQWQMIRINFALIIRFGIQFMIGLYVLKVLFTHLKKECLD